MGGRGYRAIFKENGLKSKQVGQRERVLEIQDRKEEKTLGKKRVAVPKKDRGKGKVFSYQHGERRSTVELAKKGKKNRKLWGQSAGGGQRDKPAEKEKSQQYSEKKGGRKDLLTHALS